MFTCKDCPDREPGCHGYCKKYKREKEEFEKLKLENRKDFDVDEYVIEKAVNKKNRRAKEKAKNKRYKGRTWG